MSLQHIQTIGGRGPGPDKWEIRLAALACADGSDVWALGDAAVRQFDRHGNPIADFELEQLGWSVGVDAVNHSLWVGCDGAVANYSTAGQRLSTFQDSPRLGRVTAIERVGESIIVGDANGRCLRVYDLDGRWLRDIATNNRTQGLLIPNGVVDFDVDRRTTTLVVANPAKHRLERYATDGELLGFWGRFGMHDDADFSGCCNPTNVAVAPDGRVVVTEKAPPRLKVYSAEGELLAATAKNELFDPQAKNMCLAASDARVYVADTARLAIMAFEFAAPEAAATAPAEDSGEPLAGAAP